MTGAFNGCGAKSCGKHPGKMPTDTAATEGARKKPPSMKELGFKPRADGGATRDIPTARAEPREDASPTPIRVDADGEGVDVVLAEVERATAKFPTWPTDPLHALAVLGEEFGELTKAMLQLIYEPHKTSAEEVRTEAIQTAAMALRLVASLKVYEYRPGPQHKQEKVNG